MVGVLEKFIKGRVAAGDPVFTAVDAERDPNRWTRILTWLDAEHEGFAQALGV